MTDPNKPQIIELDTLRSELRQKKIITMWRSLEELAHCRPGDAWLQQAFPDAQEWWDTPVSRRTFLQVMAASMALAGLGACTSPPEQHIYPYARQPEGLTPGTPLIYATAMPFDGYGFGVLARSNMGRPTKIEGNPGHPASLGGTDAFMQASVLQLWDPDRSQAVLYEGNINTWDGFAGHMSARMQQFATKRGAGLYILTPTVTSPTLAAQLQQLQQRYPAMQWHQWQPVNMDNAYAGAQIAFGRPLQAYYQLSQANVIVTLDDELFGMHPARLKHARDFASRRTPGNMNRIYAAETIPGMTGAIADNRLPLPAAWMGPLLQHVATLLGLPGATPVTLPPAASKWAAAAAADLRAHAGHCLLTVGERQPATLHAQAHAINAALGNIGTTLTYTAPVAIQPASQIHSISALAQDLVRHQVELLVILGGNPAFTAPANLNLTKHLKQAGEIVHLSLYDDETAQFAHWHLPQAHYLESWGDIRAFDGTASIIQPLIAPLHDGRSELEVLNILLSNTGSGYDAVQQYWQQHSGAADFEKFWQQALYDGVIRNTALPAERPAIRPVLFNNPLPSTPAGTLELDFLPDPCIWDGQFANLGWLQELARPISKLVWDNAIAVSPATAAALHLNNEDVIEIHFQGGHITAPVLLFPGQADNTLGLFFGNGRQHAGRVGNGVGFNCYPLRTTTAPWFGGPATIHKTAGRYPLVTTQIHHTMEGRDLVRAGTLQDYIRNPAFAAEPVSKLGPPPINIAPDQTLYPQFKYAGYKWGMNVNLSTCIGCSACVTACQAENNIPVVGKDNAAIGREMLWLRIDRYYEGPPENPRTYFQPVPCMQCENAPCELVCPVEASIHDSEGINVQVYNRCVGTRFCSNNCPYKVRRFNFLAFSRRDPQMVADRQNPEVTVRMRGVMEKCNYCLQRTTQARIEAEKQNRRLQDGEVMTACQAACPTGAIVFGDLNDSHSQVHALAGSPLNYALLAELNTNPRTTYLAKVTNPNPEAGTEPT